MSLAAPVVLLAAFVVLLLVPAKGGVTGQPAPDFALPRLGADGEEVALPGGREGLTVVNFWASWCVPCEREMPAFQVAHLRFPEGVSVLGVNTADDRRSALAFMARTGTTYPSGFDSGGEVARAYRLLGMPTTVFVSEAGTVIEKVNGELSVAQLIARIEAYRRPTGQQDASLPRVGRQGLVALANRSIAGPLTLALLLVTAFAFGAVHSLGPGHGKTIMAAWLAGGEGGARDAVAFGASVAAMHSLSVVVLAALLVQLDRPLEARWAYLGLLMALGLAVVVVGVRLLVSALTGGGPGEPDHHPGAHHHHRFEDGRPGSRQGLVTLALAGGLFPSPSALLLLVTSVALGRAALGLALIAAFSLGLAATLVGIGLGLVGGRRWAARRWSHRALRGLRVVGASWLITVGGVVALQAAIEL